MLRLYMYRGIHVPATKLGIQKIGPYCLTCLHSIRPYKGKNKTHKNRHEKVKNEGKIYPTEALTKAPPPSGEYQYVRNQLKQCNTNQEIMEIINNFKTDDATVYGKAMQMIGVLNRHDLNKTSEAIKLLFEIFEQCKIFSTVDACQYNILLNCCSLLRSVDRCVNIFDEMISNGIPLDRISLETMLQAIRTSARGNVSTAKKYWQIHEEYGVEADALNIATFINICGKFRDVQTAEEFFSNCKFQRHNEVCKRLMQLYKSLNIEDGEMRIKTFIVSKINIDIMRYIQNKQNYEAINAINKAVENNEYNPQTLKCWAILYSEEIGNEVNEDKQREHLHFVENDLVKQIKQCDGGEDFIQSEEWGRLLFQMQIQTYPYTFGAISFGLLVERYGLKYWDHSDTIPSLLLNGYSLEQCKFLLKHIFFEVKDKLDAFREVGLWIIIDDILLQDITKYLNDWDIPLSAQNIAKRQGQGNVEESVFFISAKQTVLYEFDEEEPLFG